MTKIQPLSVVMVVNCITRKVRRQFLVPLDCQNAEVFISKLNDEESMDDEPLVKPYECLSSYPVEFEMGVMEL